jgi:PST family polysaccharide transporter
VKDGERVMNGLLTRVVPRSITEAPTQLSAIRKILANTGWLVVDNLISVATGLFVGAWVARYLGPARYGTYNYALAFVSLFTPLVGLGLKDIVIRDIVRRSEEKEEILGTAFGLQFVGSLLALGIAVGVGVITRREDIVTRWLIGILAGRFVFQALSQTLDYWFQSQVQVKYTVWAKNIGLVVVASVKIGLILSEAPLIAFAWAALGEAGLLTAGLCVFYRFSREAPFTWGVDLTRAMRLVGNSWPLIVSAVAVTTYMKIGQVMLGNMADETAVGLYAAAARLSEFWYFIPMAVSSSVFPSIVWSREKRSEQVYRRRMQVFYDVMAGIGYAIAIPLALVSPLVIRILFGPEYSGAGPILRVHVLALVFVSVGVARSRWLIAEDMIQFSMLAAVLGALVNVGLNLVFIPRYGGLGVAWAVTISQAVSAYLSSVLSRRLWPVLGQVSLSLLVPFRVLSLKRAVEEGL